VLGLLVAILMVILLSSSGPAIKGLYDYLWFFPRSTISRVIYLAVIAIGLLAGFGVDVLKKKLNLAGWGTGAHYWLGSGGFIKSDVPVIPAIFCIASCVSSCFPGTQSLGLYTPAL
jgi:hypothetical protein